MEIIQNIAVSEFPGADLEFIGPTKTIREQLFDFFGTKLATMLKANGYNLDLGTEVFRSFLPTIDFGILPAVGFMPRAEESINLYGNHQKFDLVLDVQGIEKVGTIQAPQMVELIYADIIEAILGNTWTLNFDSGGTFKATVGKYISGQLSKATGYICGVSLLSGTWAAGSAAGTLTLRRVKGDFINNENFNIGSNADVATIDGVASASNAPLTTTGGLAEAIYLTSAEGQYPTADQQSAGINISFGINYKRVAGNPYSQTN